MRGPRSRAWLMAHPVVPPSDRPMAHTSTPTRYGPRAAAGPIKATFFEKIAATTVTRTSGVAIALALGKRFRTAPMPKKMVAMAVSDIDRGQVLAARRDPLHQRGSLLDRQKGIDENSQSRRPDRRGGPGTQRCPLDRGAPTNRRSHAPHFDNRPEQRSCTSSLASISRSLIRPVAFRDGNPPNRQFFLS